MWLVIKADCQLLQSLIHSVELGHNVYREALLRPLLRPRGHQQLNCTVLFAQPLGCVGSSRKPYFSLCSGPLPAKGVANIDQPCHLTDQIRLSARPMPPTPGLSPLQPPTRPAPYTTLWTSWSLALHYVSYAGTRIMSKPIFNSRKQNSRNAFWMSAVCQALWEPS